MCCAQAFAACYMLVQVQASPYKYMSNDYLANGCSFSLLVVFICCIMYKVGTLTELSDVQMVMSSEQRGDFIFPPIVLTFVLAACVGGALVASFVILIVQVAREKARVLREARAAKARRLCSKNDHSEMSVPLLLAGPKKYFHVFLSHVWG